MRHGMTMVELLLALALLSGLALACVSWTATASRALATEGGRASWRAAAERSLDLVDGAFAVEDVGLRTGGGRRERGPRVEIGDGWITVGTRAAVPGDKPLVAVAIQLRVADGVLRAAWLDHEGRELASRPLLGDITALDVASQELEDRRVLLTLRLVHRAGASVERTWRLPRGDLR
ncbi:MAG: prepilin-type N-terminal cleavage/methylation domain-containing protein [Phycisphaerales bacterium JB054]